MKILYAARKYNKGVNPPEFSIEHINFYLPLNNIEGIDVVYYPLEKIDEIGGHNVSLEIKNLAEQENPDILMVVSFNHDLDKKIFQEIRNKCVKIVGIFFDENTDLYLRSLGWAPYLDWLVVFYPPAYGEYKKRGFNVIGIDWFVNTDIHRPIDGIIRGKDISFIGSAKKERQKIIKYLSGQGLNIETWGNGWPNGGVSLEKMVQIFNQSKINLNLGLGKSFWRWQTIPRIFFSPTDNRKGFKLDLMHTSNNFKTLLNRFHPQSHARPFEVMACKTFLLTNKSPLFNNYQDGVDIAYFKNINDLAFKIKYYLKHPEKREEIAERSHQNILANHSALKQLKKILEIIS